jgi:hypothetical protein
MTRHDSTLGRETIVVVRGQHIATLVSLASRKLNETLSLAFYLFSLVCMISKARWEDSIGT